MNMIGPEAEIWKLKNSRNTSILSIPLQPPIGILLKIISLSAGNISSITHPSCNTTL
jgi:hypothetical protein